MGIITRFGLFAIVNLVVVATLSVIAKLLGFDERFGQGSLIPFMIQCSVMGFAGSFISLMLSKFMAKRSTGARVIAQPSTEEERWLVDTVTRQASAAGIDMPEVAIYPGQEVNAFATGMSKNSALVAVSEGLLRSMNRDEVEAVLGHEISHAANGDMVTMSLLQGVMNTFVYFLSGLAGAVVDGALRQRRRGGGIGSFLIRQLLQVVLGFLASMVLAWFSRQREFRADAGGSRLAGREKMIGALVRLGGARVAPLPGGMQALGISGGKLSALFSTHPPLEERIARLRSNAG